jgi:hypothetical protein
MVQRQFSCGLPLLVTRLSRAISSQRLTAYSRATCAFAHPGHVQHSVVIGRSISPTNFTVLWMKARVPEQHCFRRLLH